MRQRHENRVAAEVAGLSSFISLHHMPGEEPDSLRRIAKISLYVDIALVGKTLGDVRPMPFLAVRQATCPRIDRFTQLITHILA